MDNAKIKKFSIAGLILLLIAILGFFFYRRSKEKSNLSGRKIKNFKFKTSDKYSKGLFYEDKGIFLGTNRGRYVFRRHDAHPSFKEYGPKYYYESVK